MYDSTKDSHCHHNFVVDPDMSYRFIAICLSAWVGLCATAGWVVERLWS
jgi:hypothetical protein